MQKRFVRTLMAVVAVALCSSLALLEAQGERGQGQGRGGGQGGRAGRGAGGRPRQGVPCLNEWQVPNGCADRTGTLNPKDFTGVWTRFMGGATMGNNVMMTPLGQKLFDANKPSFGPRAVPPALGNDPLGNCDPLGLTRNVFTEIGGRSFEMIHQPDRIVQFFEWAHYYRTIWLDGRKLPNKDANPRWHGFSTGRWEGDTLIVESSGIDERTWLDNIGHPHSADLHVQERYRRPTFDTLELQMTITDPTIYPQPWVSMPLRHVLNQEKSEDEKLETFCVPSEEQDFNKNIRNPAGGVSK